MKSLTLHGFVGGNIVLGDVRFHYTSDGRREPTFMDIVTPFTVDLKMIFDLSEPAAAFAAISFPSEGDLIALQEKSEDFSYRPYYKSERNHNVALSGLIPVEGNIRPETVSIRSFNTALQWAPFEPNDSSVF